MNNKNPVLIFTGLAIAAVAAVVGVTRERWMPVAGVEIASGEQSAPAKASLQTDEAPAVAAKSATATSTQQPVARTTGQQTVAAATEAPAATTAVQQTAPAKTEAPAATTAVEQTAVAKTEASAATITVEKTAEAKPEAPVATTTERQTAAAAIDQKKPAASETDAAPSFDTVRVEKTGEAVVAGHAVAGAEVNLKLDGETIGTAVANTDGAFVVVPGSPLPAGGGALTIEAKRTNETVAVKSEQTVAVIVPAQAKQDALVAVLSPSQPTKVLQKPEAAPVAAAEKKPAEIPAAKPAQAVTIDAVDYDETGNIVFSGRGQPGAVARLYIDNGPAGDAKAGADGRWSFAGSAPIATGVHSLRVDGLNSTGVVANRVEVPFFREETTKVASAAATATGETAAPAQSSAAVTTTATTTTVEAASAAVEVLRSKDGRIVIQPGNNLWRISNVIYGSGTKFTVLYEANKDQIRDPDLIYPGQVFMTPDVLPPETIDPVRRAPLTPEEAGASAQ
jgi:nucleoid-associated protein YgaU